MAALRERLKQETEISLVWQNLFKVFSPFFGTV